MKKKIMLLSIGLLFVVLYNGCSKKQDILENVFQLKVEDIHTATIFLQTSDKNAEQYMKLSMQEEITLVLDLLQKIEVTKQLKEEPKVSTTYYVYAFHLEEGNYRIRDYKDYLMLENVEGKKSWYQINSNTWKEFEALKREIDELRVDSYEVLDEKPVIYLYPKELMEVAVTLDYQGVITYTYPEYHKGWQVIAHPEGTLFNMSDHKEYSYLFWEGSSEDTYDMSRGFVVKGSETTRFLEEKLSFLGLTPKEYNEFIVYWAPRMTGNPYNLITFQGKSYTDRAKLTIKPEPDSLLRVYMVYQALEHPIEILEQELHPWERTGFAVVEWGGSEVINHLGGNDEEDK